jgi:hypothetical protein
VAAFAFWLVVLLAGMGLGAFELYARLASGDWPHSLAPLSTDFSSTTRLAVAVFYVPVSLARLLRMRRAQP